jgi:S1-C subfamily serine protease
MRSWNPRTGEFRYEEPRKPRTRWVRLAALLLVVGLVLALAAGRVLTRGDRGDLPGLVKRVQPAVVTVMAYNALDELVFQGSGFFITPEGRFLTNYHVLAQATRAEVKTALGHCYPVAGVVAADRDWDLVAAEIGCPLEVASSLEISGAVPEVGERVAVVGSPLGLEHTLSVGVISALRRVAGGAYLQISAPVSPGSSGSAVINMAGEVVGVASLQVVKGQNLNFAVPGSRALALQHRAATRPAPLSLVVLQQSFGPARWSLDQGARRARRKPVNPAAAAYRQGLRFHPELAGAFSGLGRRLGPRGIGR